MLGGSTLGVVETREPVDLEAALEDGAYDGLRFTVCRMFNLGGGSSVWGCRVDIPRRTASGREGKPTHYVTIVGEPDWTPADVLRHMAELYEAGPIEWAPTETETEKSE